MFGVLQLTFGKFLNLDLQLRSFRWVRVRQDLVQVFCFYLAIWKYYQVFVGYSHSGSQKNEELKIQLEDTF